MQNLPVDLNCKLTAWVISNQNPNFAVLSKPQRTSRRKSAKTPESSPGADLSKAGPVVWKKMAARVSDIYKSVIYRSLRSSNSEQLKYHQSLWPKQVAPKPPQSSTPQQRRPTLIPKTLRITGEEIKTVKIH